MIHSLHAIVLLAFVFVQQPQTALSQNATTVPPAAAVEGGGTGNETQPAGNGTQPAGNAGNGTVGAGAATGTGGAPNDEDVPEYASPAIVNITLSFSDNTSPEDPSVQDEIKQMEEEYCKSFYGSCVEKMVIIHRHTKKVKIEERCKRKTQAFSLCKSYMKNETPTAAPPPSGGGPAPQPIAGNNPPGNTTVTAKPAEAPNVQSNSTTPKP